MSLTIYRFAGRQLDGNTAIERTVAHECDRCDWCGRWVGRSIGDARRVYHYGYIRKFGGHGANAAFCCKSCAETYLS